MIATAPVRLRPRYAPSANSPAVAATYAMVCANKVWAWSRVDAP